MRNSTRVLVTGSEGFIGRFIVDELLSQGFGVIGIDNLSKYGDSREMDNKRDNYQFVLGDVTNTNLMIELLEGVDHLIAGAALIGGISYFHSFPYDLLAQNEKIIASTCDAAIYHWRKGGFLKKVTYLSSSMVYESTSKWPSKEGDQFKIPPPLSSYGFQKLAVEYFARAAFDQYGLPFTICRPFNCIGTGEAKSLKSKDIKSGEIKLAMSHVIPDLIQKTLKGQNPLRILGSGNQIRHYTYGPDLAKGISMAMSNLRALNEDFNLSTNNAHSVLEVAKLIWEKINPSDEFQYISEDPFKYDVQRRTPDVSKAKNILGFEASTSLEEVLDEIISWVRSAIDKNLI